MPRDSCLARSGGAEWWRTANGRSATPPDAERREREGGEQIVTVGTGGSACATRVFYLAARVRAAVTSARASFRKHMHPALAHPLTSALPPCM